jgi:hypothetical protein
MQLSGWSDSNNRKIGARFPNLYSNNAYARPSVAKQGHDRCENLDVPNVQIGIGWYRDKDASNHRNGRFAPNIREIF